jgi:DNA polymerase-1
LQQAALTAFDTETTSLDPIAARLVGMSLCIEPGKAAYPPLHMLQAGARPRSALDACAELLRPWLENRGLLKLGTEPQVQTRTCCANHGVASAPASRPRRAARVVRARERTCATTWTRWPSATSASKTITYDEVAGKGAKRIGFDAGAMRARPPTMPPRTPTSRCNCTRRC